MNKFRNNSNNNKEDRPRKYQRVEDTYDEDDGYERYFEDNENVIGEEPYEVIYEDNVNINDDDFDVDDSDEDSDYDSDKDDDYDIFLDDSNDNDSKGDVNHKKEADEVESQAIQGNGAQSMDSQMLQVNASNDKVASCFIYKSIIIKQ